MTYDNGVDKPACIQRRVSRGKYLQTSLKKLNMFTSSELRRSLHDCLYFVMESHACYHFRL